MATRLIRIPILEDREPDQHRMIKTRALPLLAMAQCVTEELLDERMREQLGDAALSVRTDETA